MKKYLSMCVLLAAAIALTGCGDNKTKQKLIGTYVYSGNGTGTNGSSGSGSTGPLTSSQNTSMLGEVFYGFYYAMAGGHTLAPANLGAIAPTTLSTSERVSFPLNNTLTSALGGTVLVNGTYSTTGSVTTFNVTETWNNCHFTSTTDNGAYQMNGIITLSGTFDTSATGSSVFFTESVESSNLTFHYGSSVISLVFDITSTYRKNGTGSVSGSMNGQSLNFTY